MPGNLRVNRPKVIIHGLLTDMEQKETIIPPVFGKERQRLEYRRKEGLINFLLLLRN